MSSHRPGERHIPVQALRDWMASDDPLLHHLAFHTALSHPGTVEGLTGEERLRLCLRFLEAALGGRYGDSIPDGPYVTAHTVLAWLERLMRSDDPADAAAINEIVAMLERVARQQDAEARDVIVLGVLEHAFEDDALRVLFEDWANEPDLAPLYEEALRLSR